MQYRVYDNMSTMTEEDVTRLLSLVGPQRRDKALRYTHLLGQWTTLKTAEMLQELSDTPELFKQDWRYNEYGKPYLAGGPEFSISHCRAGVAVAIDDKPIGIDIETIRPYKEDLAHKVMNEEEQKMIDEVPEEEKTIVFTRLWTQKEAVLKLRGTGIVDDLKQVLVGVKEKLNTTVNIEKKYVLTIAES